MAGISLFDRGGISIFGKYWKSITLDTAVAKGTWTASGTWTLPPISLGGTVTGGGQQFNNTGKIGVGLTPTFGVDVETAVYSIMYGKWGSTHPMYVWSASANCGVGFNVYYNSGWKFGKGSSSKYAGYIQFDVGANEWQFMSSTATGNADAAATMTGTAFKIESGGIPQWNVTAGITASTTQTQGQGALTTPINEVSVCANANDVVTLPSAVVGMVVRIANNGAQTLQVFPASGDNIDGAGVDTSVTQAAGTNKTYVAHSSAKWDSY